MTPLPRFLVRFLIAVAAGAVLGLLAGRAVLVGSGLSLIPWAGLLVEAVQTFLARMPRWALHVSGDGSLLTRHAQVSLADSEQRSALRPFHVTIAIGYDGRADIAASIRNALRAVGDVPTPDDITANLPGGPVKEIDLVIRTGNEWRISGFFPWQASQAELFFSAKHWPAFTRRDFEEALRHYSDARTRSR